MKKTYNKELADNLKFIVESGKMVYGAAAGGQKVTFAYGTLAKAAKSTQEGQIAFGVDTTTHSGAIYVAGTRVTSKIQDVVFTGTDDAHRISIAETIDSVRVTKYLTTEGKYEATRPEDATWDWVYTQKITVSYVDDADGVVKNVYFDNVTDLDVVKALIKAQADANAEEIEELQNRVADTSARVENTSANVRDISTFLRQTTNITEDTALGAITVTATEAAENVVGTTYKIGVKVDGDTIKVDTTSGRDYLVTDKYDVVALDEATAGYLKTYQLQRTDVNGDVEPLGKIDIPRDQVIKDVHSCWAIKTDNGTYEIIKVGGEVNSDTKSICVGKTYKTSTDGADITIAEGDLSKIDMYLHFTWANADATEGTEEIESETYLKVSDMAPVYHGDAEGDTTGHKYITIGSGNVISWDETGFIANLFHDHFDTSINAWQTHFADIDTSLVRLNTSVGILDASVTRIEKDNVYSYVYDANTTGDATELQGVDTSVKTQSLTLNASTNGTDAVQTIGIPTIQGVRDVENKFDTILAWVNLDEPRDTNAD